MKVQILEKIYHSSENPVNIRLLRRLRELHWIKELGTAAPYGCNDQIKGVGTLSSPSCKHTNVLGIFNKQQRRKRSHGHRHYNKKTPQLDSSIDTLVNLIDSIDQPQGVHKIETTLFSISLLKLHEQQSLALESTNYDYESAEYRVTVIILDTAQYRLFRPVHSDILSTDAKTHFIKLDFINKGIDAVNLPSILRSKSVIETVPTYFKEKEPPIISYTYTKTIANKIFNFSSTFSVLDYHQFHNNPSQCECNTSRHLYQPYGHVITGDLSIIPNFKLRDLIAKGPKYRERCKVDWDKNLSLLCEAVDQYALQWAKREIVELSVLSSWKEMVKGQIELRLNSKVLPRVFFINISQIVVSKSKSSQVFGYLKGLKYRERCKVDWDKNLSLLCEAVDQYALQWAKREIVELSVLSSWKEMVKGQIELRLNSKKYSPGFFYKYFPNCGK